MPWHILPQHLSGIIWGQPVQQCPRAGGRQRAQQRSGHHRAGFIQHFRRSRWGQRLEDTQALRRIQPVKEIGNISRVVHCHHGPQGGGVALRQGGLDLRLALFPIIMRQHG